MTKSRSEARSSIKPQTEAGPDLTYVYTLIHSFLKERSHAKAASALKKAVNGIVTLEDDAEYKGPTLQKILEEWKVLKAAADAIPSSDSDSDSSDVSSSDDDSEAEKNLTSKRTTKSKPADSSGDDHGDIPRKSVPIIPKSKESLRGSSKTLSSADDVDVADEESTDESSGESDVDTDSTSVPSSKEGKNKRKTRPAKKPATSSSDSTSSCSSDSSSEEDDERPSTSKRKAKSTSSSGTSTSTSSNSSSSSSSSSDSDSDEDRETPTTNKLARKAASSNSDSSSESEDSSSDSSSKDTNLPRKQSATQAVSRRSASSSSSSSQSEGDARATKKRRANKEGTAVVTSTTTKTPAGNTQGDKASRKPNAPFQRVNANAVNYYHEKLKDNSFESRGAHPDDYGARANRDLIVTRGDGFRKEKNKKKRGSYRGGDITLHSHSFKFEG